MTWRAITTVTLGCATLVLAVGCAAGADPNGSPVTPTGTGTSPSPTAGTAPDSTGTPSTVGASVDPSRARPVGVPAAVEQLVGGLTIPWSAAPHPGGGWLVSLRDEARILHVAEDGSVAAVPSSGPDGSVPGVTPGGEGGLLGLAVLERDATDGTGPWVYAYTTVEVDGSTGNAVVRMLLDPAADTLGDPEPVLAGIPGAGTHNGGRLAFGPDGMLYVTTGDGQVLERSQDLASLGGKILRVTPRGAVPPDNPFPGSPVWTLGHRNVQGIGWDASGRMFASEFGQNRLDELNLITPGANYGWPRVEGAGGIEGLTDPLVTWATSEASPSGLAVTGDAVYLAALRGRRLWRVPLGTGTGSGAVGAPEPYLVGEHGRLRDAVVTGDGDLLVLTSNGDGADAVLRVTLG